MASKPTLRLVSRIPRLQQTISDQLVLGLVTGGLLGHGLVIEKREAGQIRFTKARGILQKMPDRGDIFLSRQESGETEIVVELWCTGMSIRRLFLAALLGSLAATTATLLGGFWIHWTIITGIIIAILADISLWWLDRHSLRKQVESYLHNTNYLKSM